MNIKNESSGEPGKPAVTNVKKAHVVFLALGSNMGDRRKNIDRALSLLKLYGLTILKVSSIIETEPVGGPPQEKFLNAALKAETSLNPVKLLSVLKSIETEMGRKPSGKNFPRPIDIDILLYDNISINSPTLIIPHPRMFERDFVKRPLKEIEPHILDQF
ncbi:MAG: 2-amino-4-hydroxy-6-hydroxymethyldihydropteridine diphosphokinase [Candidatus Omnitrophota bacterium]